MPSVPTIELNDGNAIPQLGFGVFKVPPEETAEVVRQALEVGYRHIDTAEMYGNEQGVGEAVRDSGLDRSDVFVTSKLNNGYHEPGEARRAFDETLSQLGFFPKSMRPERMRENFEIFDFELGAQDVERIDALDQGEDGRVGPNPDRFAFVPD